MRRLRLSGSLLVISVLSACGGGGGVNSSGSQAAPPAQPGTAAPQPGDAVAGGSVSSPTPAPTPAPTPSPAPGPSPSTQYTPPGAIVVPAAAQPVRSANDTTEYRRNYVANELIGALYAQDHGWTGQGVTVGVMDDGVNTSLAALDGQISGLSKDFGSETSNGVTTKRDRLSDAQSDHGTAVAAIIAARRDGNGSVGVAPDAKIAILRTSDYNHDTKNEVLGHDGEALLYAAGAGIKVVNRSLASQGFNVALRNAVTKFGAAGGLLVNAAGNSSGDNPIDAVNVDASNRNAWLFVVALDPREQSSYSLASYSNRAGTMGDRTVTAVGTNTTTRIDGTIDAFSGTSSATAQVSGLVATILSKWPQLTGVQAGQVILDTARDIGASGVDAIFGAGLIDARAALSPVNPTLSNGSVQTALASSVMVVPDVIGAVSIQTALSSVTVLDEYGRDFTGSVADMVIKPETQRAGRLRNRVAQMANGGWSSLTFGGATANLAYASYRTGNGTGDVQSMIISGDLAYQAGGTAIRMGLNAQDSLQTDIMGLAPFANGILAYAPQAGDSLSIDHLTRLGRIGVSFATGRLGLSRAQATTLSYQTGRTEIRASWIDETGSVMGVASVGGALSLGRGARTGMVEVQHTMALVGAWNVEGYGSIGATRLKTDLASVVTGASSLIGTRAGVQASGPALGGVVSFGIAQPLTIERGEARLTLASGYDPASQTLVFRSTAASLASTMRPLQLTAGFAHATPWTTFRIGVMQDVTDGSTQALASISAKF